MDIDYETGPEWATADMTPWEVELMNEFSERLDRQTSLPTYYAFVMSEGRQVPLRHWNLTFTIGPASYSQDVHAVDLREASRVALDTIDQVEQSEGQADGYTLTEFEII